MSLDSLHWPASLVSRDGISGQTPATAGNAENVILVTLDGARTQEMFGGLNRGILASTLKEDQKLEAQPAYTRF